MTGYYSFYNELNNVSICQAVNFTSEEFTAHSFTTLGVKHLPGPLVAKVNENGGMNPPKECWFELEDPLIKGNASLCTHVKKISDFANYIKWGISFGL